MIDLRDPAYLNHKKSWNKYPDGFPLNLFDAKQFVDYCELNPSDRVLEIGIGGGDTPRLISAKASNCIFIDFDEKAVIAAKQKYPHLKIIQRDAIKSKFKSGSFDKVLARYVIHNFPSHNYRTAFYKEMSRILAVNGELILGMVPNKVGMLLDMKNYLDPKLRHRITYSIKDIGGLFWCLSIKRIKEELHDLSFEFVDIRKTPEPQIEKMYHRFLQVAKRFFLPLITQNPIIYTWVDIKFRKAL